MKEAQARIIVRGRVQGVFFRHSTREKARSFGLLGWVKNLDDGGVEIFARGPQETVEKLVEWCQLGPPNARVEKVDLEWLSEAGSGITSGGTTAVGNSFEIC